MSFFWRPVFWWPDKLDRYVLALLHFFAEYEDLVCLVRDTGYFLYTSFLWKFVLREINLKWKRSQMETAKPQKIISDARVNNWTARKK